MTPENEKQIIEQQNQIIEKLSQKKEKDNWDKLSTLSAFLSSIVIGTIGIYFANAYKAQEVRVGEFQIVEKFIPILAGNDENAKKGALLTIASLSNQDLAIRLGTSYASPGTIEAMEILLKTAKGENETLLRDALVDAYYYRADNFDKNANYDRIINDVKRILELKPVAELKKKYDGYFLANCYQVQGFAYHKIAKYKDAYDSFQKSLEVVPNFYRANWGLGMLYWQRNDQERSLEKALSYFDQAIANYGMEQYYMDRGRLHHDMGHMSEAIADFDQYISIAPNDSQGYTEKAYTYSKQGHNDKAVDNLQTALLYVTDPAEKAYIERLLKDLGGQVKDPRAKTNKSQ